MNKKLIIVLFISLAIAALVYMWVKEKKKKQTAAALAGISPLAAPTNTNGGASGGVPALATQGINGNVPAYPSTPPTQSNSGFPLGIGSTGVIVKMIQAALNLKVDGVYGSKTDMAVKLNNIDLSTYQKFVDRFITVTAEAYKKNFPLQKGSKNNYVKAVQIFLGLTPDGVFGSKTEASLQTSVGKKVLYHADYTALFSAISGHGISYNGKSKAKLGDPIIDKLKSIYNKGLFGVFGM